jgi:SH3-like domain-containing protein
MLRSSLICRFVLLAAVVSMPSLVALPAMAAGQSGLPVPRFVSLRSGEVNVRTGPGARYPVEWVFTKRGMPVEVIAEFDTYRKIRDHQGASGWVHQSMLVGKRSALIVGATRTLRKERSNDAQAAALVEPGLIGRLLECRDTWCRLEISGYKGWLKRDEFWGTYPGETVK